MSEASEARDRLRALLPDVNGVWRDYGPVGGPDMTCVSLTPDQADALADRLEQAEADRAALERVKAVLADHRCNRDASTLAHWIRAALNPGGTDA